MTKTDGIRIIDGKESPAKELLLTRGTGNDMIHIVDCDTVESFKAKQFVVTTEMGDGRYYVAGSIYFEVISVKDPQVLFGKQTTAIPEVPWLETPVCPRCGATGHSTIHKTTNGMVWECPRPHCSFMGYLDKKTLYRVEEKE